MRMPHFDEYGGDTWLCQKCAKTFNSMDPPNVWVRPIGNVCINCLPDISAYIVRLGDGPAYRLQANSLAEAANAIRGKASRVRIWSRAGVQLIDTDFGDTYGIAKP